MKNRQQHISLRGTLADDYHRLYCNAQEVVSLQSFIRDNLDDLLCINHKGIILIGRKSDRGKFKPDW